MNNFYKKGISAVEVMVVLAVIVVLIAVVVPQFSKIREHQVLKAAVSDVLSALNKARAQTLASVDSSEYGVRFESDQVLIFKGTSFSAGSPDNQSVSFTSPASIVNVTLGGVSGTSGDVYFNRLYAVPSATGTVTISTGSYSKIITISASGLSSVN